MFEYKGFEGVWIKYNNIWKFYEGFIQEMAGDDVGVYFFFEMQVGEFIEVRLGIFYVSIENVWANLEVE